MKIIALNQFNKKVEVTIENGKFKEVVENNSLDLKTKQYIIPGFIDSHTHGGYGYDWLDNEKEQILMYLNKIAFLEGVTSVYGTTITTEPNKLLKSIVSKKWLLNKKVNGANFLGLHIEGPLINVLKKGGHPAEYMSPHYFKKDFEFFIKSNEDIIKLITFAPEITDPEVSKYLSSVNVVGSCGHSVAIKQDFLKHEKYGLKRATHYNNAMIKFDPNNKDENVLANYEIANNEIYIELISDGIHNSEDLMKMVYKNKPKDKLILITDSLGVKGLADGVYEGPNWKIVKRDGAVYTESGILNGSAYTMNEAFKNWIKLNDASLNEAVLATSTNVATQMKLNKGKIEKSFDADFLILDENLNIKEVFVGGHKITKEF